MAVPKQVIYPIRYFRPLVGGDEEAELRFSRKLRGFLGAGVDVIALGRARAGIYLLAKHARSGSRNRVVMLPYTIPDVVNMVRFAGCEPVFADTLPDSTNVDVDHLESLLDDSVCCVLLTHYHVNQNRLDDVRSMCAAKGIRLFDDCAIVLGGRYRGGAVGTLTDASVFSMSGFKALNYIWGGAVTTRDEEIGEALKEEVAGFARLRPAHYRRHMMAVLKYDMATRGVMFSNVTMPILLRKLGDGGEGDPLAHIRMESNGIDETIRSRPSLGALDELDRKVDSVGPHLEHRQRIAGIYDRHFADRAVSRETSDEVRTGSCYVNYPVVVDEDRRAAIYYRMMRQGFHIGLSAYPNAHEHDAFRQTAGRSRNVARLVRRMITLPTHHKVASDYASALAGALQRLLSLVMAVVPVLA